MENYTIVEKGKIALLARNIRNTFKKIEQIYENKKLDEKSKIEQITPIITKNKDLFEKKIFLKNKSVFDIIKQFNTKCSSIPDGKVLHTIDKKISYLEKNPELTKLIGKILKEQVQQSIDPINNEDDFCEDLETSECAPKNYNRNQVICNLQKGTEIENAENSKSCTMANNCKRQESINIDDKKEPEEDKNEEVPEEDKTEEVPEEDKNEEPQLNKEKVPQEPPKKRSWMNQFFKKSGGKLKKSTKRKNKMTKKKKKSKRKTRSKNN